MDELTKMYIDFINWLDPYWECHEEPENVLEIELPEMLYNLEEIKKDWQLEGEDLEKINEVIAAFKNAGIEVRRAAND